MKITNITVSTQTKLRFVLVDCPKDSYTKIIESLKYVRNNKSELVEVIVPDIDTDGFKSSQLTSFSIVVDGPYTNKILIVLETKTGQRITHEAVKSSIAEWLAVEYYDKGKTQTSHNVPCTSEDLSNLLRELLSNEQVKIRRIYKFVEDVYYDKNAIRVVYNFETK